jgi:hypothetical protein
MPVKIEDVKYDYTQLMYVPDTEESRVSSRVQVPGFDVTQMTILQKLHPYKSARGDPFVDRTEQINYSQLLAALEITRPNWGVYFVMFQGTFAAVAVAFIGLSVKNESRFDLGVGAFFACVAATYISSTNLPMTGEFTLADVINGVSLFTIFLTLLHAFISKHIFKNTIARWFDLAALFIFVFGYSGTIAAISLSASDGAW